MANELVRGMMALVTGEDLSQDATEVPFAPTGTISATTVQTAVAEAASEAVHLTGTETITGAKTLSIAPVAPGVTAPAATTLALRGPLGVGATDVAVTVGSSVADADLHATSVIWEACAGIGGTKVRKCFADKAGFAAVGQTYSQVFRVTDRLGGASSQVVLGAGGLSQLALDVSSGAVWSLYDLKRVSGSVVVAQLTAVGSLDQAGTDSTGTPGATTTNKPTGKASIAAGAASVTITNNLVTASSRVLITPHARDATCKELIAVPGAGSFTVAGSAVATADVPFSWQVSAIL